MVARWPALVGAAIVVLGALIGSAAFEIWLRRKSRKSRSGYDHRGGVGVAVLCMAIAASGCSWSSASQPTIIGAEHVGDREVSWELPRTYGPWRLTVIAEEHVLLLLANVETGCQWVLLNGRSSVAISPVPLSCKSESESR